VTIEPPFPRAACGGGRDETPGSSPSFPPFLAHGDRTADVDEEAAVSSVNLSFLRVISMSATRPPRTFPPFF